MPEDNAWAMLRMIDQAIADAPDQPQRRSALKRFRALIESDLAMMAELDRRTAA
ncbi:hypothetical protein [Azospirillum canadense]|uniref:hypothetical protein n=1 Tax=Azospirillum canadense TaxID=403962 RepID=UPI0022272B75|nr:hypothetical protein [Azospirillum canadense]MCW2243561.1 hypothetical protein [Azospirillum canadense]